MERRHSCTKWALTSPVIQMQVSITLILTTIMTVMALLIWKETTESQYSQVETFSRIVRNSLLQRTQESMLDLLQSTRNRNELISRSFGLETLPTVNNTDKDFYDRAHRLLWPSFKMSPQMGSSYFVRDVDGVSVGFSLWNNHTMFFHTVNPGNLTIKAKFVDNDNGEDLSVSPLLYDFVDTRLRFPDAFIAAPDLTTRVGLGNSDNYVMLEVSTRATVYTPLLNSKGNVTAMRGIRGTVESVYPLEDLSTLMSKLDLLGGVMFATSESGILAATSDNTTSPFQISAVTNEKELVRAAQVNNSLVAGTAQWLESKYGNMSALTRAPVQDSDVKIGHRKYFIDTDAVQFPSFKMVIVVVIPRESIMGEVDKSARRITVFLSSLSVACLAIGLGLLLLLTKHMANGLRLKKELSHHLVAKQRAEACTASARLFLANLSHDLRTPMAAIIGLLDMMSGNGLEAEQMGLLEQVQGNADTLHTLLNSVLDISTVEAGTLQLCCAPFDILKELEAIVDLFSIEGMNKGVDVLLDLPEEMPRVEGDAFRFRQIFANILRI